MPSPKPEESREDWMKRCVPIVIEEGTAKDGAQAAAICSTMWKDREEKFTKEFPVEVMSVGVWNGHKFTLDDLVELATNFQKLKDTVKPPVKLGHVPDKGAPAYGWVTDLKVIGSKLMATLSDVPRLLLDAIKAKRYRRVSSEIFDEYSHGDKKYGKVFAGLALLGAETPAVSNLKDLQVYLTQNADGGKFEKVLAFDSLPGFDLVNYINYSKKEDGEGMDAKELEKKLQKFQDQLTVLTEQNTKLKTDLDAAQKTNADLEAKQLEEAKSRKIAGFKEFCEKHVKGGRMLPAQRDLLIGDTAKLCFTEEGEVTISLETFQKCVELSDKVLEKKETAQGRESDPDTSGDVQEEMDRKVSKFMAEKGEKDYIIALEAVMDSDPDLAKRYTENTN